MSSSAREDANLGPRVSCKILGKKRRKPEIGVAETYDGRVAQRALYDAAARDAGDVIHDDFVVVCAGDAWVNMDWLDDRARRFRLHVIYYGGDRSARACRWTSMLVA